MVAANRRRDLQAFSSPIDSRHGSCRVCPLDRFPAFAAASHSETHSLQPTTASPRHQRLRYVAHFVDTSTRASKSGIPTLPAKGKLRSLERGAPVLPSNRFTSGELPRFPAKPLFRHWLRAAAGLTCGLQPSPSKQGTGTRGALILGNFRARLHGQRLAMAASGASRSTQ